MEPCCAATALLLLRMTAAQLFWTRRLRRLPAATDRRLCEIFSRLRDGRAVRLLNCDGVFDSPASFGLFHTDVFFPEKRASEFSDRELKMMLAHEIAHADRHDCLRSLLLNAVTAFLWFNPFAAWLRRRIALLREVACDRAVLRRIPPDGAADYARLLYTYGLKMRERHFAPGPDSMPISDRQN
ncbi:MAG: M56 family metallopeptidase [Victivallaceae bacterium]|nr:M56 family metallopeptidase [Victivallaceae bacterium]